MKYSIIASIAGATLAVSPVMAADTNQSPAPAAAADYSQLIDQVAADVKASPDSAPEIVKQAILKSKANSLLVAQIVAAATFEAPEQIHNIYNASMAVAPDAGQMVNAMITAVASGDEVAWWGRRGRSFWAPFRSGRFSFIRSRTRSYSPRPSAPVFRLQADQGTSIDNQKALTQSGGTKSPLVPNVLLVPPTTISNTGSTTLLNTLNEGGTGDSSTVIVNTTPDTIIN